MNSVRFRPVVVAPVLATGVVIAALASLSVLADEGMWLFNQPPRKQLKEKYGFEIDDAWLEHLQKSAVRFNSGGSGSFVSANGLVMTNHHVGVDALQKLSTPERDLVKIGFRAKSHDEEIQCVDLELNVLYEIEDVTPQVAAAVKDAASPAAAQQARQAVLNELEESSNQKTGLRSDVVTLFQGERYHLYRFKKYTDVRLVFAPEKDIAFFGGDPDNFEYPRYDLDICFFRVYEDGKPIRPEHYLKWSAKGAGENELIFVAGHPGRTNRLNTHRHLEFLRDRDMPFRLNMLRRREVLLRSYADRGIENARQAADELFSYQNSRKARIGGLAGLQDPAIMEAKAAEESELKMVASGESDSLAALAPWQEVETAIDAWGKIYEQHWLLERGAAFNSTYFTYARQLVRLAEESAKPNARRLREFAAAGLDSLKQELLSEAPIHPEMETLKLADSLGNYMELVGASDPTLLAALAGKSPRARAAELISGTNLGDVAFRQQLLDGGASAIESCDDPLIVLAKGVDGPARAVRTTYEQTVEEPLRQAYEKLAKIRFRAKGEATYPDATFTLRLAYGEVKGFEEGGRKIPAWTTLGGAFEHSAAHAAKEPFALPKSWLERKNKLKLDTPFNFVSTADIIGGNSGSPVVNRKGELVGIIFDGNIQSLVLDFAFTQDQARAVSVHSSAIVETLKNVYDAKDLAAELTAK